MNPIRRFAIMTAVLAVVGLVSAGPAAAAIVDFTYNAQWGGADGTPSFTFGGIRISTVVGTLSFNGAGNEPDGCDDAAAGLTCDGDGIGINPVGGLDDEVGGSEVLRVEFLDFPVNILGVEVLDLFKDDDGTTSDEGVEFSLNNVAWSPTIFGLFAPGVSGGYNDTGYTASNTQNLYMRGFANPVSDVALARIEYAPVPEPGTLALLGMGLAGLGARARRRNRG